MNRKPKLLLHTCCGTCGAWIPEMLSEDFEVDLYYFNPNIHPEKEYLRRLEDVRKVARALNLKLIEGNYNPRSWFEHVKGLEGEPEGGKRCTLCFELRLREAAKYASENSYDIFGTTLTIGRNKRADIINPIGEKLASEFGLLFLDRDFKKQAGFEKSCRKSDEIGVVRQNYCGCSFSLNERLEFDKNKNRE
ncbi:MAG: epoxyqueuosine reductase QueH [Patescibacteria group bacterium]|nr:epoxyqueuosine reductase QueH [Patescibacteria group bacterium]